MEKLVRKIGRNANNNMIKDNNDEVIIRSNKKCEKKLFSFHFLESLFYLFSSSITPGDGNLIHINILGCLVFVFFTSLHRNFIFCAFSQSLKVAPSH